MTLPIRIIIEGANYAGKDTLYSGLLPVCKNAFAVYTRGYWRSKLLHPVEQGGTGKSQAELLAYFQNRTHSLLSIAHSVIFEELIFFRLHLTDCVYGRLYADARPDYSHFERELNENCVGLLLLDVDDATLAKRREDSPRGSSGFADRSLSGLLQKRDLYREEFERSLISRKLLLNNSSGVYTPEALVQKVLEWWQKTL